MSSNIEGIQMIGIQRSGSNLLRVILEQSPEIAAPHPPHLIQHFRPLMCRYNLASSPEPLMSHCCLAPSPEPSAAPGHLDAAGYRLLVSDLVAYVEANPVPWEGVALNVEDLISRSRHFHLFEAVRLIYEQAATARNARYWCCKSMTNVYFAEEMEAFGIHPKYIYMYRDGRDVAASFKKAIVGEKHIYHLATQWKDDQLACLALKKKIQPSRFFSLSYEQLISAPEDTIRALCQFLDIPFKEDMLQFYGSNESKNTAAAGEMWSNVTNPIMSGNSKKFLRSFSQEELELFELIAGDQLRELGYELYTRATEQDRLSPESVAEYDAVNRRLKKEIQAAIPPDDLEKRKKQSDILAGIKGRTTRIPPVEPLIAIAQKAGQSIMDVYNDPSLFGQVSSKEDASPLTLADKASHEIIVAGLKAYTPAIPVLSEEGADIPYEVRRHWEYFWCVDPLDGTREFLKRNGEFCINIALFHRGRPVFGLVYVPVTKTIYYGSAGTGSWKQPPGLAPQRLFADVDAIGWTAVGSRSHAEEGEQDVLGQYPVVHHIVAGSALKFCLIAEGKAHIYYRQGPTMEWDTAAGHAIVEAAGGRLTQPGGQPFLYNKERLVNGPFLCSIQLKNFAHA